MGEVEYSLFRQNCEVSFWIVEAGVSPANRGQIVGQAHLVPLSHKSLSLNTQSNALALQFYCIPRRAPSLLYLRRDQKFIPAEQPA